MPSIESVRRPPQWLRVALAALLIAFALNSIAHVAHQHESAPASSTHSVHCVSCVSFGALADAPRHSFAAPTFLVSVEWAIASPASIRAVRPRTAAQPRAPPLS